MSPEQTPAPERDDSSPRGGSWASLPKRNLSRAVLLLAMLAGILYLRQRTGSIADCMSKTFQAPASVESGARGRLLVPGIDGGR